MNLLLPGEEAFYQELIGLTINVPCNSWNDPNYCLKCFGENWEETSIDGEIMKVKLSRSKPPLPVFTIQFPKKKYDKVYQGFDFDYILKYCTELPEKYQLYKAHFIVRLAREAEAALVKEQAVDAEKQHDGEEETDVGREEIEHFDLGDEAINSVSGFPNKSGPKPAGDGTHPKRGRKRKVLAVVNNEEDQNTSDCSDDDADVDEVVEENEIFYDPEAPIDDAFDESGFFDASEWELNVPPVQPALNFTGSSGPQHSLPTTATPFDYFCLFIPMFFWAKWAAYTNTKAEMRRASSKASSRWQWTDICEAELKAWVASVMVWCLFKTLSFESFFKERIDIAVIWRWFRSGWRRWHEIKMNFKVSDPQQDEHHKEDKMDKIRELWDSFIGRCKAHYWPSREVGLDEAIKKFKGRCSFKQYIKNKPVRWGIKVFCVCCSATGYLWNAAFYLGKTEEPDANAKETSATTKAVLHILEPLAHKNHIVHMDNFYTSIPLFSALWKMGIQACGTVRTNRKGLCPQVAIKKSEESSFKKQPGMIRWASRGALCFIAWFAKRPVHILTNCYLPTSAGEIGQVLQWFTEAGAKIQKLINRPPAVKFYNMYMGAVDLFDQLRSYIKLDLPCNKFWHPMFWFVVESALVNSWVLYKATRESASLPLEYTHLQFRKSIAMALAAQWEAMGCRRQVATAQSPTSMYKKTRAVRVHQSLAKRKLSESPSCAEDKHMSFLAAIPLLENSSLKKRQMRCCFCKDRRTKWWCSECTVPLCKDNCYIRFHTK